MGHSLKWLTGQVTGSACALPTYQVVGQFITSHTTQYTTKMVKITDKKTYLKISQSPTTHGNYFCSMFALPDTYLDFNKFQRNQLFFAESWADTKVLHFHAKTADMSFMYCKILPKLQEALKGVNKNYAHKVGHQCSESQNSSRRGGGNQNIYPPMMYCRCKKQ